MDVLNELNTEQSTAVSSKEPYNLVLAGAGSGKTRVLVHRIAWLVQTSQCTTQQILAVTFTNKAAAQMRSRTESLLLQNVRPLWIGTFHGLAHRLLRQHWQEAGLPEKFQILDQDDQLKTVRRTIRSLELDEKTFAAKQTQWFINHQKEQGLRPQHLQDEDNEGLLRIYAAYQKNCDKAGLVDFAEILLRAHEMLQNHDFLLKHYQQRFRHVLVDEFQDTNTLQFAWLRLLVGGTSHLFVVGDDDQSIYSWRGAKVEHMTHFSQHFNNPRVIRLEQNYRSTGTILAAANALIANNHDRLGKNLWTQAAAGEPILVYEAFNDVEEADFIGSRIENLLQGEYTGKDIAILYRSNAQSRLIEEALLTRNIAYRVYGGLRFFDRAEIKDTLAYLRLIDNRLDDASFERIINVPQRGIGARSLDRIRVFARQHGISYWQSTQQLVKQEQISGRINNALQAFLSLITNLSAKLIDLSLAEQIEEVIISSGLPEYYLKEGREKAQNRRENLNELCSAAVQFCEHIKNSDLEESNLTAFLAHTSLETHIDHENNDGAESVQLMTLHSAKGLEFPIVFLAGLEEDLFPHKLSKDEPGRLEEERRLCYVGMTRARKRLLISYARRRRLYGNDNYSIPSRFLSELPKELLQFVNQDFQVWSPTPTTKQEEEITAYPLGQRVFHANYGEGVVTDYEGRGSHTRIQIHFDLSGDKWLPLHYANLDVLA